MTLEKHDVVVTGGSGALGRAVVGRLLRQGAVCHVPVYDLAELDGYPHKGHERLHLYESVDLTSDAAVAAFYESLPGLWASIHLAGGFDMAPIAEVTVDHIEKQIGMNLMTCFLCCREAVKAIRRASHKRGGRIVNIAARPALEPRTGARMTAYTASKAAVAALTQALAEELAGERIAVNAIAPSIIDTPANRSAMPAADHAAWPKPDELAETIVSLVGLEASITRGAIVPVYGRA